VVVGSESERTVSDGVLAALPGAAGRTRRFGVGAVDKVSKRIFRNSIRVEHV
jgi:hypothetical protein